MKVISQNDYSFFKGKTLKKLPEFFDTDADFESIAPIKRPCVDLTIPYEGNQMSDMMNTMEALEKAMKQSIERQDQQEKLKRTISSLENEKAQLADEKREIERSLAGIVCKSIAKFPWQCCHILLF